MGVFVEGLQLPIFLTLICILSASCSGIVFGFASLRLLLEADGVYQGLDNDARDKRMMFLYSVGSTLCTFSAWLTGSLVDRLGPIKATCFFSSVVCAGLLLLGLADERSSWWIVVGPVDAYVVSVALVGVGGIGNLITSLSALYVIPPSMRPFTSAVVNTLFDASSVVWSMVFELYSKRKISRPVLMCGHALLCATLAVLLALTWANGPAQILQRTKEIQEGGGEEVEDAEATVERKKKPSKEDDFLVQSHMWSFPLAFSGVFMFIEGFASNLQLGYVGSLLEEYGDGERDNLYTQIFGLCLPFALLMVPFIGRFLAKHCISDAFLLIVGLSVFWKVISLIPILPIQVPAFLVFTTFRAFLYAANALFLSKVFKSNTFGAAMGTISLIMASATATIYPVVQLATALMPTRPFFLSYSLSLVLSLITIYATLRLKAWIRDARRLRGRVPSKVA